MAYFVSHTAEWLEPLAALLRVSDRYTAYLWIQLNNNNRTADLPHRGSLEAEMLQSFVQQHEHVVKHFMPFAATSGRRLLQTWKDDLLLGQQQLANNDSSSSGSLLTDLSNAAQAAAAANAPAAAGTQLQNVDWFEQGPIEWPPITTAKIQRQGGCVAGEVVANVLVEAFKAISSNGTQQQQHPQPGKFKRQRIWNATLMVARLHRSVTVRKPVSVAGFCKPLVCVCVCGLHRYEGPLPEQLQDIRTQDAFVKTVLNWMRDLAVFFLNLDVRSIMGFVMGPEDSPALTLAKQVVLPSSACRGVMCVCVYQLIRVLQVKDIVACDFEDVIIKCNKKRTDTFVGTLAVCCLMLSLYFAFGSMGVFFLSGISLPLLILWFVYGYTPGLLQHRHHAHMCALLLLTGCFQGAFPWCLHASRRIWPASTPGCCPCASRGHQSCRRSLGVRSTSLSRTRTASCRARVWDTPRGSPSWHGQRVIGTQTGVGIPLRRGHGAWASRPFTRPCCRSTTRWFQTTGSTRRGSALP